MPEVMKLMNSRFQIFFGGRGSRRHVYIFVKRLGLGLGTVPGPGIGAWDWGMGNGENWKLGRWENRKMGKWEIESTPVPEDDSIISLATTHPPPPLTFNSEGGL